MERSGGDGRELGRALANVAPFQAQPLAHEFAQVRLVQVAGGLRGSIQGRAVQGGVAAVAAPREVRRDDVGVQLWIEGATHPMPVGRRHQPLPRLGALAGVATANHAPPCPRDRRARRAALPRAPGSARASPRPAPTAASTLTDFGAEKVRSRAAISGSRPAERRRTLGLRGSIPAISALNCSPVTCPSTPSALAPAPTHSPGASPRPL